MGYNQQSMTVIGRTSSHNDERDEQDEAAWDRFVTQVRELADRPEFAELSIMVSG